MRKTFAGAVFCVVLLIVSVALSAFVPRSQDEFEDRPVIIVSTGSVILNVARGSWVRGAAGTYRQDVPRGKDVKSFSATTGAGAAACTVAGESLTVTYGANAINIGRPAASGQPGERRAAVVRVPATAKVTSTNPQTIVIDTSDALVSVSNGTDTCRIAGGRVQIRQVH